jgi:uncharacterized protein YkwD
MSKRIHNAMTRIATMVMTMVCTFAFAANVAFARTVDVHVHGNTADGRELLTLVNADRAAHGLAALAWDECLEYAALQRSCEQVISFSHTRPDGTSCFTAFPASWTMAENLGWGQRSTTQVNTDWINSPGHHANMLRSDITRFGAAHAIDENGNDIWVECFSGDTNYTNKGLKPVDGPVVAHVNVP